MNGSLERLWQGWNRFVAQQPRQAPSTRWAFPCEHNPRFSMAPRLFCLAGLAPHYLPGLACHQVPAVGWVQAERAVVGPLSRPGPKGCLHPHWSHLRSEASCFHSALTLTPVSALVLGEKAIQERGSHGPRARTRCGANDKEN